MNARARDVSSDDDDGSSDVTSSSVRRRHRKDDDSDVPRFFYGRSSDPVTTATDRQLQTDDVDISCVSRDAAGMWTTVQTDDVDTARAPRDTPVVGRPYVDVLYSLWVQWSSGRVLDS